MGNKEVKPWDFLKPGTEYASDVEADRRFEICNWCPKYISLTGTCKECGCFMKLKTKLQHATCPLEKW